MSIYFIDYENVNLNGLNGIETLTAQDRVYLFYGANPGYIPFERHIAIAKSQAEVTYLRVDRTAKNYLDFQLATYSGYLVAMYSDPEYIIVSRDTGFDSIVNFWNRDPEGRGVHFSRREAILPQSTRVTVTQGAPQSREFVPTRVAPTPPITPAQAQSGDAREPRERASSRRRGRGRRGGRGEGSEQLLRTAPLTEAAALDRLPAQEPQVETELPILPDASPVFDVTLELSPKTEEQTEAVEIAAFAETEANAVTKEELLPAQEPIAEVDAVTEEARIADAQGDAQAPIHSEPAPETKRAWGRLRDSWSSEGSVGAVIPGASASSFQPMPVFPFMKTTAQMPMEEESVPSETEPALSEELRFAVEDILAEGEEISAAQADVPTALPDAVLPAPVWEDPSEETDVKEVIKEEPKEEPKDDVKEKNASRRTRKPKEKKPSAPAKPASAPIPAPAAPQPMPEADQTGAAQGQTRLAERFKSRIRDAVKEEGLNSGGYTQIYNRILKCDNKSRLNNELVKAFSQEKGGRIYKLILPVYEEYRRSLE